MSQKDNGRGARCDQKLLMLIEWIDSFAELMNGHSLLPQSVFELHLRIKYRRASAKFPCEAFKALSATLGLTSS